MQAWVDAIYEVFAFYDDNGKLVEDEIPKYVSGFAINRIPINQEQEIAEGLRISNSDLKDLLESVL